MQLMALYHLISLAQPQQERVMLIAQRQTSDTPINVELGDSTNSTTDESAERNSQSTTTPPTLGVFEGSFDDYWGRRPSLEERGSRGSSRLGLDYSFHNEMAGARDRRLLGSYSLLEGAPIQGSRGFTPYRTSGPYTTFGYTLGYYTGKFVEYVGSAYLQSAKVPPPASIVAKQLLKHAPDGLGEASAEIGNHIDNADVHSHNVRRSLEILTYGELIRCDVCGAIGR